MNHIKHHIFFILVTVTLLLSYCTQQPSPIAVEESTLHLPEELAEYNFFKAPESYFKHQDLIQLTGQSRFGNDPIGRSLLVENNVVTLGRVLFYDKKLSINNTIACASCHAQERSFTDNTKFSKGFKGILTPRNSMAIINSNIPKKLFWDSRAESLEKLALEPVKNHIEMGMESMSFLSRKLALYDYYPDLFEKAYGSTHINEYNVANALTSFMKSLVSFDSKYDQNVENNFSTFSKLEKDGHDLFFGNRAKCGSCHAAPSFAASISDDSPYGGSVSQGTANIGLDVRYSDNGRGDGFFRIPTLRNISVTGPYMHDGRYESLTDVIDHYDHGVQNHPNLDKKFFDENGFIQKLNLSLYEKESLIAFLNTLTDESFLTDEKFSNPFK